MRSRNLFSHTLLSSCDDRHPDRIARSYEVAYILLGAAVGYDALAPDEALRFERGEPRLLFDPEARLCERIGKAGAGREDLARRQFDQDATRILWAGASRVLAEYHRSHAGDVSGPASMQRSRDAARVLAAVRSSATSTLDRGTMLVDALKIDRSFASESVVAIARTVWDEVAQHRSESAATGAAQLAMKLERAGFVRASDALPGTALPQQNTVERAVHCSGGAAQSSANRLPT